MFRQAFGAALLIFVNAAVTWGNDVDVYYNSGDVIIIGDSDANDLEIRRVYSSIHQIRGLHGTRINGSSEPLLLPILDDLKIRMLGGDDFVDIKNLYLRGTSHADLAIELGQGDDELRLESGSVSRNVMILDGQRLRGNDTISIKYYRANSIDIETQEQAHIVVAYNTVSWIAIESGLAGADFISVVGNDANLINIDASNEDDELIFMGNDVAHGILRVFLNDGNDSARLSVNVLNVTNALFDGGPGFDIGNGFAEYRWPWWGNVQFANFELY